MRWEIEVTGIRRRDDCCAIVFGGVSLVVGARRIVAIIATESTFYNIL